MGGGVLRSRIEAEHFHAPERIGTRDQYVLASKAYKKAIEEQQ
jgi:hypothetical protein